jgi:hypothetical protein
VIAATDLNELIHGAFLSHAGAIGIRARGEQQLAEQITPTRADTKRHGMICKEKPTKKFLEENDVEIKRSIDLSAPPPPPGGSFASISYWDRA